MSAEPGFDRARFAAALTTRVLGRALILCDEAGSTNDVAWEAMAAGGADGTTVIAERQPAGRGRAGRRWHLTPDRGLALSVALSPMSDRRETALLPLAAGLALAEALESLGAAPELKWPNDVLIRGRKLAGILAESRRLPGRGDTVVVGVGINVLDRREDFPAELRERATSLTIESVRATREAVAAAFLAAFERRSDAPETDGRGALIEAWSARAPIWGRPVVAHVPAGEIRGVALRLDSNGGLVLRGEDGTEAVVLAGDVMAERFEARS
ncbi:MAG TPA: biotin--[acetyl-CoA-carboxylase] ligase [Dongiaceae bacterium]|nr:biotin--[acetyl-CoA-carboxylase] ligase [Dongiaceae bacterium]